MLKDLFFWIIEQILSLVTTILGGMGDLFSVFDITSYISSIPASAKNIMSLIGFGEALGMIVAAITIRLLLQLIPFTRLGS